MGHFPTFSNIYFSTYQLFVTCSVKKKVFILLIVILSKDLCKNVTLRGHVFFIVQILLQLALTFIALLK